MHEGAVVRSSCLRWPAWGLFVAGSETERSAADAEV